MINEVTKQIERTICIEPAKMVYRDTGRKSIQVNEDGENIEVPIKERVMIEAKFKDIVEEVKVYQVEKDGEVHEFAELNDAKRFLGQ